MATMTQPAVSFAAGRHHFVTAAALVTLFWIIAATGVALVHIEFDSLTYAGAAIACVAIVVFCAYAYSRLCVQCAGISHALAVGIAWLVLGIVTELVVTMRLAHGWFGVLGSPERPLLRNIFLFVWIFAPAIFARREGDA